MKFPILASYAYARKTSEYRRLQYWLNRPDVDILLDSGAFTAHNTGKPISLDEYCKFLDDHRERIFRYIALDVIGDPVKSEDNLTAMIKAGYKPAPVHVLGDDQRRMDQLFELSDFVCLGGLLRPGSGHASKAYLKAKMTWAAGRPVHWLGFVRVDLFNAFRPESADSTAWAGAHRYGYANVYLGGGRWIRAGFNERHKFFESKIAMHHIRACGYTARHLDDPRYWRHLTDLEKNATTNITADSWVRYVVDIYKRFGVRVFMVIRMIPCDELAIGGAIDRHLPDILEAQPPETLCSPSSV